MNEFDKQNHQLWKFGILYYNPKDPSFFVEKRNGLGWTLNFGNKHIYVMGLVLLICILVLNAI